MRPTYVECAILALACAGCTVSTPSTLTVPDPQIRHQNIDVAMTDAGTARTMRRKYVERVACERSHKCHHTHHRHRFERHC